MKPAFKNEEENLAAAYLRAHGFTVLSRNDRRFGAELDFLCARKSGGEFFIFEVKRKPRAKSAVYPRIAVSQLRRLKKAATRMQTAANKFLTIRISLLIVDRATQSVEMIADI
ncbi:MAG: YraN family protein [Spirochaetes bacterium]|nr:YraN family protein [Spirochaetota bacterium]MBX3722146.1 YraN family protein [Turneriella sp.]